jgi:protein-disulfide isomerase
MRTAAAHLTDSDILTLATYLFLSSLDMTHGQPFELTMAVSPADHAMGPPHAPVTVVEYGDFECPNCKQAAPVVKLLLNRFRERMRFVYRHFPLEEVHPHALNAAEASECAAAQGKFWPMHDLLFNNQPHLKLNQLSSYAERLQLDMAHYTVDMKDHNYLQRIREHEQSGRDSGVRNTPTFFVNRRIHDVSFGAQRLFEAVEAVLRFPPRTRRS